MRQNKLGFNIPEQTNNSSKDFSIPAIESWRSNLKMADTSEVTNNILTMLKDLNTSNIEPNNRFQILEIIRPITLTIMQSVKKSYTNRTQPLSTKKQEIINLTKSLLNEVLIGYKITVIGNSPESLPNAIYRCFKYSNHILSICYDLYTQPPENIWKEIHSLYRYAEDCNISKNTITIELAEKNKTFTVISPYKLSLFLAATNPYQWRQVELELLFKYADLWEEFITIRPFKDKDLSSDSIGIFLIPTEEDQGPVPTNSKNANPGKNQLVIDLSLLIEYLKKNTISNIEVSENEMAKFSLQKLVYYLLHGHQRKLVRFNILGQVAAAFGFLSTHYHINKKITFKPDSVGSEESTDNNEEFQLTADTMLDEFALGNTKNNTESEFKADTFLYKCNLVNIHGEGAGIKFKNISFPPIQPGELVAMTIATSEEDDLNETHWNIGTVRWLKHDQDNNLTAGVQILAPFAIASAVQLLKKDGSPSGYFQRALLFQDEAKDTYNLITPVMQFESGKKVKVYSYYHKDFVETELKTQVESTSNFKRFVINIKLKDPATINKSSPLQDL